MLLALECDHADGSFQTLVRPLVEYASTVWNPYTKTEINKIETETETVVSGATRLDSMYRLVL
jgi:hypothetical protein